jgi:membrane protein implicated in regulation of membrane protease activity
MIKFIKYFAKATLIIIMTVFVFFYICSALLLLAAPFLPNYHWYLSVICFFMYAIPITYILYKNENNR